MEPKSGGLEDDFLLQFDGFFRFHVNFPGCMPGVVSPQSSNSPLAGS